MKAFLGAVAAGYEKARTDPQAAATALLAAAPELDKDLVTRSAAYLASRYGDAGKPWGVQDPETWAGFGTFLKDRNLLPADVEIAKAFTNDLLPRG